VTFVFFTDRDLGIAFPEILRDSGLTVERHRDHFPPACPDEEWLEVVGRRGWVALTHDTRIRYKPNQLEKVVQHNVRLLVLVGKATFRGEAARLQHTSEAGCKPLRRGAQLCAPTLHRGEWDRPAGGAAIPQPRTATSDL
jgi:hypothetical protein